MNDPGPDSWRRFTSPEESDAAMLEAWQNEQWSAAASFCGALAAPEANLEILQSLVTPESLERWGDFRAVAARYATIEDPAYGSVVNPAFDTEDVGYFKVLRGVSQNYQVVDEQPMLVAAVVTVVRHPFEKRWMVEAFGEMVRPESIPCMRGDTARWDGQQRRRFDVVPMDAWLTQHGTKRMDGSGTYNFPETPRWNREGGGKIELDVSMLEGRVSVAEAVQARRRMSPVRPKDRVRYFLAHDLYDASYLPCRTPNSLNLKHVSVYGNMTKIAQWTPPGQDQLSNVQAHRRWWDQPDRVTLESLRTEVSDE
ncbi:hypothetical protein K7711_31845 [Nocardia sp. CA2R105]|uniref:hypothetical protein n=1 Tax=Nocardia coffeae TaxID=2873381 RepID=UPI001CA659EC|nr:hypothetical protein [Nocardia coffeae]MBY8861107.1 hypothetical protein [Nocardia coffeae]